MTRRAVFSSRFSTFSIIIRSLRERWPPATLSATISRSSSSRVRQLGRARAAQAQDPERQVARLVQQPDHRREDVREDDQRRRGQERQDLGLRIARVLGACSPSAMCRKVTSESEASGTIAIETPKTPIREVADPEALERPDHHRLDPVVHGRPEGQAGDRDPDLRGRQVEIEPIERLAGQPGRPVALLGELIDLGRPHLDQGELDRDEKPVDQDQTRR